MSANSCDCEQPPIRSVRDLFVEAQSGRLTAGSKNNTDDNTEASFVKICAPMVRYSQLPFRLLTRKYGCHVAFSPMIVAQSFAQSEKARLVDFSTCPADRPLVVQFGATNSNELVEAASHVVRFADGVDVNCGCPQKWAIKEGLGSALLNNPELIRDMVQRMKNAFPSGQLDHEVTTSVKIRIFGDVQKSVDFARQLTHCGLDFLTIHGRTVAERSGDAPHWDVVAAINELALKPADCPLVVNGAIKNLQEANAIVKKTGALGAMAAEGIMRNPALFQPNCSETPNECITDFLSLAHCAYVDAHGDKGHNLRFDVYRKHLCEMLNGTRMFGRRNRDLKLFNTLRTGEEVNEWLQKFLFSNNNKTSAENVDDVDGDEGVESLSNRMTSCAINDQ